MAHLGGGGTQLQNGTSKSHDSDPFPDHDLFGSHLANIFCYNFFIQQLRVSLSRTLCQVLGWGGTKMIKGIGENLNCLAGVKEITQYRLRSPRVAFGMKLGEGAQWKKCSFCLKSRPGQDGPLLPTFNWDFSDPSSSLKTCKAFSPSWNGYFIPISRALLIVPHAP